MENIDYLNQMIEKATQNGYVLPNVYLEPLYQIVLNSHPEIILFNHDFARAYWRTGSDLYELHLSDMVIHKNPIDYARKFL